MEMITTYSQNLARFFIKFDCGLYSCSIDTSVDAWNTYRFYFSNEHAKDPRGPSTMRPHEFINTGISESGERLTGFESFRGEGVPLDF